MKQRINLRSPFFIQHTSRPAEASATNLYLRSQELSTSPNSDVNLNVSTNAYEAPDGTQTAEYFTSSTDSSTSKYLQQNVTISTTATKHTLSIYVKMKSERYITLQVLDSGYAAWINCTFDLLNSNVSSQVVGEPAIEYISNGWYRCSVTAYPSNTGTGRVRFKMSNTSRAGVGFLLWGSQMENGSLSSYIPTLGTTAVRSATPTASELPVSADIKVWSGSLGYPYDRTQHATNNTSISYGTLGGGDTVTTTQNVGLAPDGNFTASRVQADNLGSGYSLLNLPKPTSTGSNSEYVSSIYVKSNTNADQDFVFYGVNSQDYGPRVFTATSEWQRFHVPDLESGVQNYVYLGVFDSLGSDDAVDLLVWGYQYEQGTHQVTDFMINETSSSITVESYSSSDEPTENTYELSNDPIGGITTFELGELIRDYIDQSSVKSSGSVWVKITLSDGLQMPRTYTFLATEGYITNFEGIQSHLNAPSSETLMQSNSNVIVPEGESISIPVYAKYNSYYTKTTLGATIAATYFTDLNDSSSQIEYIDVTSDDTLVQLYVGGSLIHTITIEVAECSKFANNKLMFVNRFGAKQEFFVNMKSIEKIRIKDSGFNRNVINYSTLSINNGVHGYKRNVTESRETYTLNTPFLDEGNVQAFEELLLSEYVWMKKENSEYIPVTIKDNSMTRKTHVNDKLIQYTVNVESSFNLINNQR